MAATRNPAERGRQCIIKEFTWGHCLKMSYNWFPHWTIFLCKGTYCIDTIMIVLYKINIRLFKPLSILFYKMKKHHHFLTDEDKIWWQCYVTPELTLFHCCHTKTGNIPMMNKYWIILGIFILGIAQKFWTYTIASHNYTPRLKLLKCEVCQLYWNV